MTVKINADTSDGLKLVSDTSGTVDIQSNGTTKMTVGTTIDIQGNDLVLDADGDTKFKTVADDTLTCEIGGSEVERITPVGKHLFGSTQVESTSEDNMQISTDGGNIYMYQHTTALQGVLDFRNPNGYIGSIRTTGSSVQYNTSSDYRMKSNINYTWTATDTIKALQPCTFTFNGDTDTTMYGFIAHELQEHIPQAVSGVKDAVKIDGNGDEIIDPQSVDLSKVVPFLVKTIQELEARITALENN